MKDDLYNRIRVDCASNNGFVITVRDVMAAVCKLKDGKATGPDGISSEAFKYACPCLSVHLCMLFNLILKHGYLPEHFMQSIFVPLLKNKCGDLTDIKNYKSIAISNALPKVFESVLIDPLSSRSTYLVC